MAEDKKEMPADGSGTKRTMPDENGELASRRDGDMAGGAPNPGESGGGPYPNPYDAKDGKSDTVTDGQGRHGYYGKGQLGEKDVGQTTTTPPSATDHVKRTGARGTISSQYI